MRLAKYSKVLSMQSDLQSFSEVSSLRLQANSTSWMTPFQLWKEAVELSRSNKIEASGEEFTKAANQFYESGSQYRELSKAMFEYSTLMDAFSTIQRARAKRAVEHNYEESLSIFGNANEILRATLHFGFLSPYVAACESLEVALEIKPSDDDDRFQGFKNAIALLEQSKLAIGLRDESHPLIMEIDAMLKFSISKALETEGDILYSQGESPVSESKKKYAQSSVVRKEYLDLARESHMQEDQIDFFPLKDHDIVKNRAYVVTYPHAESLFLLNLGAHPARVKRAAGQELDMRLDPGNAASLSLRNMPKGKIRISYVDESLKESFDEGCLFMI